MFDHQDQPRGTEKLHWEAKHVPLSVSVCSNVPEYQQPQCFISSGDSKPMVKEMIEYLIEISKESNKLIKEQFAGVFAAIDEKNKRKE